MEKINLENIRINGLNYVREIKNREGDRRGYLLIDNENKPIKDVYKYLIMKQKKMGNEINSLKRIAKDLCHFYDFMTIYNITLELLNYDYFYEFILEYLKKIDPNYRCRDCIEKSMITAVPLLKVYQDRNMRVLDENNAGGYAHESIQRISENVKTYLIYLVNIEKRDIFIEGIFVEKTIDVDKSNMVLGHLIKGKKVVYTVTGILKAAKIKIRNGREPKPIESSCIFENDEREQFFSELRKGSSVMYYFFYYLLSVTGMRISEARALMIWNIPKTGLEMDFGKMKGDIKLTNKEENLWSIAIRIRDNNPKDLEIKSQYERDVPVLDSGGIFQNLLRQVIIYRNYIMKVKNKSHDFLFVNRNGDRFLNARTEQNFNEVMIKSGLKDRLGRGGLVIHSTRHTYASNWVRNLKQKDFDIELDQLSKILGHSNSGTTRKTYIHFFRKDLLDLLKRMEKSNKQEKE